MGNDNIKNTFFNRADRAKQFAPFDALRGLREELAKREKVVMDKIDLSEDMKEEIDYTLHSIRPNDIITVIYYSKGEYIKKCGMVSKFSATNRTIKIVDTIINFDDIVKIEI